MNEELKIIITAVNTEAKRGLAEVKQALKEIQGEADKTGNMASTAMKGFAKGIGIALASTTALITAMATLGKSAQNLQKGFDKLNTTFTGAGSSSKQAAKTYKELFAFLGDHERAVETAQSLALINVEEKEMAQWTNILKGAWAEMGDKLPIEGLAEAANETINVGKVVGVMADALTWAGISEDNFNLALQNATTTAEREVLVRNTLNGLYGNAAVLYEATAQATIQQNKAQADLNLKMSQLSAYLTPLLTSLTQLGTTLLTTLGPAIRTVSVYFTALIQLIAEAIQWIGSFFGVLGSSTSQTQADVSGYQAAMSKYMNDLQNYFNKTGNGIDKNITKIKELKRQTMGFDELNVVSSPSAVSSGGGGGGLKLDLGPMPTAPNPADYGIGSTSDLGNIDLSGFYEAVNTAKEYLKGLLVLVGLVGTGLLVWNIADFISDLKTLKDGMDTVRTLVKKFGNEEFEKAFGKPAQDVLKKAQESYDAMIGKLKMFGGIMMMIAGAIMLVWGYSDAWANGIDWENLGLMLGGIALIVGGLALAFGPLAAQIGLIVGGVALLVIGIKDLVTNGYSMEAVLTVLAGALAVGIGLIWALNAALLANPITWIVIAIAALVAGFIILWNECEGFRKFWIDLWEGIKAAFRIAADLITHFFTITLPNFFYEVKQGFIAAWQAIVDVWNSIPDFFAGLWEGIKNAFGSVGNWFKDVFSKAWEGVKNVFSAGGKIFTGIKDGIASTFKTVVNGIIGGINTVVAVPFNAINKMLNKIRNVDIMGVSPFTSFWKENPLAVPQIPKLAKGGIATSSILANIGEAGSEAVLPLENNTGWMDILADRIANRNNTPSKIVLMVGERELGYAAINGINGITRQTGELQLAMY